MLKSDFLHFCVLKCGIFHLILYRYLSKDTHYMQINNNITHQIVELSEIKKGYNQYLCSYEAQQDVENYTYILEQKALVSELLKQLYTKLAQQQATQQHNPAPVRYTKYTPCSHEQSAILHFNNDKRFSITE